MASHERIYFVVYDIADPKRWRSVFKTMHGYGDWVQAVSIPLLSH